MKSKRILSLLLVFCMVLSAFSVFIYDKADAAEIDAFGIKMDDSTFNKEAEKKNNPYGTEEWFPLSTITELYVAKGNNSTRYYNTYDYNGNSMGDTGTIGNAFDADSVVGKNEGNKDGFHFMDTAGCDIYGEGQKRFTVSVGYRIDKRVMELFLTDVCGNRIGNTVTLGSKTTLDYLQQADPYENTGFISVAAGDFDGDGKDSVVVYVPEMENSDANHKPAVYMYDINGTTLTNGRVITKIYDLLGCTDLTNARTDNGRVFRNAPVVQLVAEDTDKDNVDELIITAGLNHTYDNVSEKQSQMFIMDYNKSSDKWNTSFKLNTKGYDKYNGGKRLRWAASSVGNLSIQNSLVDYPEIITSGWIDKSDGNDKSLTHSVGSYLTTCKKVTTNAAGTSIGSYEATMLNSIESSGFTKGGHYLDDVQCILPVAAFLADGVGAKASVLISDTVYTVNEKGELEKVYRDGYFNDDDDGIGSNIIQNGLVQDVVTGNFDGNEEGREQVLFTTCQKRQSFSQYFNKIYTYQKDEKGEWSKEDTGYFFNNKNWVFVSLCALDTDSDSTIVKLDDVEHSYTEPELLAVLESTPYFGEIEGGDVGNSQTTYGTTEGVGNSTGTAHGLTTEIIAGYELDIAGNGAEFELSIENNFTWETVEKETVDFTLEWANDTGDNVVIVYRRPVTSWKYKVKNTDSDIILARQGDLLTSMITVDAYNDAAEEYDDLSEIPDSALAEPGNPFSYRNNLGGLDDGVLTGKWSSYNGSGTPTQAIEYEKEQEKTFTYELNTSFTACAKVFGVKAGGGAGYAYSDSTSTINTSSITKSGTVSMVSEDGYDFSWMFAHWTMNLNDSRIPVLGYVLKDVYAPASPPEDLSVSEIGQTSATITWEQGKRSADEYRIYQLYDDGSTVQIGVVDGTESSYRLTRLRPNTSYTYVLTAYTESGASKGESVPSEEVKVTTLPDGVESVKMIHPQDTSAKVGGSASFSADINVISEDYQATNYQWQKRVKGEAWEDISGETGSKLTVSNITMEDDQTEYRCIFKVSYSSSTALVRYYSNAATLTVGKTAVEAELTITGHDNTGAGTLNVPYKGKSDYQVAGTPQVTTTTKEVNVEIPEDENNPKLTVYKDEADNYYGIGETTEGDAVYYTVTKTPEGEQDIYTAGSVIDEVTTPTYEDVNGTQIKDMPSFGIDTPVVKDETYYLRGQVTGTTKTPASGSDGTDTRLATATAYTFYWYSRMGDKYYTYNADGSVGEEVIPDGNKDSFFDVYLIEQKTEDNTENGTETGTETGTENSTAISTETVILGREETWMVEDGESSDPKTYEETTGYLYTRLIKTTGGEQSTSIGVTVMEMTEKTVYMDSEDQEVNGFNPSAWSNVTKLEEESISIPTYVQRNGYTLTLTARVNNEESGSAAKGAKVDFQIINTKTNAQVAKSATANSNGVASTTWKAAARGLYKIQVVVREDASYAKYESAPQYYEAVYTYGENTKEYRLKLVNGGEDTLGVISFGESVSVQLQERMVTVSGNTTTYGAWGDSTENVAFTYALNSSDQSSLIQNAACQPPKAGVYTFCAYTLPEGETEESIAASTFKGNTPLATASLLVNKVSITATPDWDGGITPENATQVTLVSEPAVSGNINLKDIFDISCSYFEMTAAQKAAASGKFAVTAKYKVIEAVEGTDEQKAAIKAKVDAFKNNYVVTFESKSFTKKANSAQVNFSSGENGTIKGFYDSHFYPMESGSSRTAGTKLRFQAVAKDGYAVDYWMINGEKYGKDATLPTGMKLNDGRDILDIDSFDLSKHVKDNALTVKVFYTSISNPVTYSVVTGEGGEAHGTLSAVNSAGNAFESGTRIRNGSSVTFTAVPEDGYVVEQWLVNQKLYHWSGTEEVYRGTTLVLEDIQSAQNVVVSYKKQDGTYKISSSVADEAGNEDATLATISAVNAETKETLELPVKQAAEGTSITFKATVTSDSVNMVKEWQFSTDQGATYQVAKGSGGSDTFTLYNVGADTVVRAVVTKAQTYSLNYQVKLGDTTVSDANIASLTASSNGQSLASGSTVSAYIPVDFKLTLNDNYYLVKWSDNVKADEEDSTEATMESLTRNATVTVTIAEKPVIRYGTYTNGTVTATMKDPTDATKEIAVENGAHVALGTDVTLHFTPKKGYETGTVKVNNTSVDTAFADGNGETTDVKTCTLNNIQANQNIEAAFTALDEYSVDYGVVNTIVGQVDGSISAAAGRKGLDDYEIESLASGAKVYEGSDLIFTAVPETGYRVKQWKVNGEVQTEFGLTVTKNTLQIASVGEAIEVTVEFIKRGDKVTIQSDENGKIVSAIAGGREQLANIASGFTLGENASVTITAEANAGYEVKNWTVNDEIVEVDGKPVTDLVYTYKSDGTKSGVNIRVHFQQIPYEVSWSGKGGAVSAEGYEGTSAKIRGGSNVTFKVTPDEEQRIHYWTVNGVKAEGESSDTFTWTVPNGEALEPAEHAYKIQAICKEAPFKVTYSQPEENGGLSAIAGSNTVVSGDTVEGNTVVTFTATPDEGYMVGKWMVNGETIDSQENTLDVTVKKNTDVSVTFIPDTYTVTAVADGSGTIAVGTDETGSYQAKYGSSLTFTAKADAYCEIGDWYVDGVKVSEGVSSDNTTFTLTDIKANQEVKVQFIEAVYYKVSYSVEGEASAKNGTLEAKADDKTLNLSEGNDTDVNGGVTLSFEANPNDGFMVDKWYINGEEVEDNITTQLAIEDLSTNADVKVLFKPYAGFDIPESGNGYIIKDVKRTPDDTEPETQIRENGTLTFTVIPNEGNEFNALGRLEVNGYDCISGKLVDESQPITGCDTVESVKNPEGSYTITIKDVTGNISLTAESHILEKVKAKKATCIEEGNIEYWVCNDENCPNGTRKFADETGNKALSDGEEIIPVDKVNGHDYSKSNVVFQWSADGAVKAYATCSLCGAKKEVKCTVKKEEGIGTMTYTATAIFNKKTYTDTKTVKCTNSWAKTVLRLQASASKTSIKMKWNAVPNADGYVIYQNKCGAKTAMRKIKVIQSGKTLTWTHKKLKKNSQNRYYVKAYKTIKGKRYFIKTSNQIHLVTKGGQYTNVTKVKSSVPAVSLRKGKTKALKITQTYAERNKKLAKHMRPLTFTTSDKKVATVTSKGVIKAKAKGSCYIYITAYSGVYTRVKVTVK